MKNKTSFMTGLEGVIASLDEGRSNQQKCSIAMDCIVLVNQLRIEIKLKDLLSHKTLTTEELLCRLLAARTVQQLDTDQIRVRSQWPHL